MFQIFVSRLKKDWPSYFTVGPTGFEVGDDAKRELLLIICPIFGEQRRITFSMELMDRINNQDCIRTPLTLSMQVTWCWQTGNQLLIQSQTFDPKSVPSAIEQPLNSAVKCKFKSVSIQLSAAFTGSLNQNLDPTGHYNNLSLTSIPIVVCSYCPLVTTLVVLIVELHCPQLRPPVIAHL